MKLNLPPVCAVALALASCQSEECDDALQVGDRFKVTIVSHEQTFSACPDAGIRAVPGDSFEVAAGETAQDERRCLSRSLIGDRPDFVPEAYGTCGGDGTAGELACRSFTPDAGTCRSDVELRLSGFGDEVGELRIYSTQQTHRVPSNPSSPCSRSLNTCGDLYSVRIRKLESQ
jgi:hypothetical protein